MSVELNDKKQQIIFRGNEELRKSKEADNARKPETKSNELQISQEEIKRSEELDKSFNNYQPQKKKRGRAPKVTSEQQAEIFEKYKNDFYNMNKRELSDWEVVKPLMKELAKEYGTSVPNVYLMARRHGVYYSRQ